MIQCKIQLDWLPNAQFAGLIYALEEGWYSRNGIELELIPWYPYLNQVDVLKQGGNILVSTDDNLLIKAAIQGEPVRALAPMLQYSGHGWMVLKEHKIESFEQLRGKKIGIHTDGKTAIAVVLNHVGLTPKEVEIEEVGFDYEELMRDHEVTAMQCFAMVEPVEMKAKGYDFNVFMAKDYGYRAYAQVFGTTQDLVSREKNMLADFLQISFDGWRAAFQDPEKAAAMIVEKYHKESKKELETEMIRAIYPLFPFNGDDSKMGMMEEERWIESFNLVKHEGYDIAGLHPEDIAEFSIINEVLKR